MTQTTLNNYMSKLAEIQTHCNDETTTKLQLETLLNELSALDDLVDVELETLPFPTTTSHLNILILIQVSRSRKSELHSSLYKLIDVRNGNLLTQAENQTTTQEEQDLYALETIEIKKYIETIIDSCTCMSNRIYITNKCTH